MRTKRQVIASARFLPTLIVVIAVAGNSVAQTPVAVSARTWTNITGNYQVVATFRGIEADQVRLETGDSIIISVPLFKLSIADRAVAKLLQGRLERSASAAEPVAPKPAGAPPASIAPKPAGDRPAPGEPKPAGPLPTVDHQPARSGGNTKEVDNLVAAFSRPNPREFQTAINVVERGLLRGDGAAARIAGDLLGRRSVFLPGGDVSPLLDEIASNKTQLLSARLLSCIAQARKTVQTTRRGHVVVGRLLVDGNADPELVTAQMPILPEGYFAGEVADLARPISFRMHGYHNLDVPLPAKATDALYLGEVRLKQAASAEQATLRGTVALDGNDSTELPTVRLSIDMGPINTTLSRLSVGRRRPEPIAVPVTKTGEFIVQGLSPSEYRLQIVAKDHLDFSKRLKFSPGEEADAGSCRLLTTDLGFYIGKSPPPSADLAWEKDYTSALDRAKREQKPLLVMMTATWCGYCKLLESRTLNNDWVRYFLASFVMVKAYEDKQVERKYGSGGYPTLVFANSEGELAFKTVGYKPTLPFCDECRKAFELLKLDLPPEMKILVDKQVLARPAE